MKASLISNYGMVLVLIKSGFNVFIVKFDKIKKNNAYFNSDK
ncbi:hypothetical protein [Thomasclavelia cocleata]|nr:hypothetical protein [Thomasclavelia cocleata]